MTFNYWNCFRYFLARDKDEAVHLYKSRTDLSTAPHTPSCLICQTVPSCHENHVIMSPDNSFFIQEMRLWLFMKLNIKPFDLLWCKNNSQFQ